MSATIHNLFDRPADLSSIKGDFPLDENVIVRLPEGTKVLSAHRYGSSAWTVTARFNAELSHGLLKKYFLKCATEDAGRAMMEGEFYAMTELYKTIPTNIPKPIAHGQFKRQSPPTYFFLCEFVEMSNDVPDPSRLCSTIANLHKVSVSPTGKFGSSIRTCNGRTPQATEWDSSWTSFFGKMMKYVIEQDFKTNGIWPEMELIGLKIVNLVIPKLIGALEVSLL